MQNTYDAKDIEVLEGLEPVRKRPGMYIGGTDEKSLYHLATEVIDNAVDEVICGWANKMEVTLDASGALTISDNGRGIPVDKHPKFPNKSALEVIMTTLHSGGKFSDKAYSTAGGLHGVGVSVVNALSKKLVVKVARDGILYTQEYSKGHPVSSLMQEKSSNSRKRGTEITFFPDDEIFGSLKFQPAKLFKMIRSKAYLFEGMKVIWKCDASLIDQKTDTPHEAILHFPNGLHDFLSSIVESDRVFPQYFCGNSNFKTTKGEVRWAVCWSNEPNPEDSIRRSYCNGIYTPLGGTHENGFKGAIYKSLKDYAKTKDYKNFSDVISDDVMIQAMYIISVFITEPSFQGQTKEKLLNAEATKLVENAIKDHLDHWLFSNSTCADLVIENIIENARERISKKKARQVKRKTPIKGLRLPGKLSDCNSEDSDNTELFLVEGDSAGGSAKQARDRNIQAILPLKGKILNVASNSVEKITSNKEISDLVIALGCGIASNYDPKDLRYDKIVIMTDADVDGAHITCLLMTFFYLKLPRLIQDGHLYIAKPPLYKITHKKNNIIYAYNESEKNEILSKFPESQNVTVGRFKGLGEMNPDQLKETTMNPKTRALMQVSIDNFDECADIVDRLMGKNSKTRFDFINQILNAQHISITT